MKRGMGVKETNTFFSLSQIVSEESEPKRQQFCFLKIERKKRNVQLRYCSLAWLQLLPFVFYHFHRFVFGYLPDAVVPVPPFFFVRTTFRLEFVQDYEVRIVRKEEEEHPKKKKNSRENKNKEKIL